MYLPGFVWVRRIIKDDQNFVYIVPQIKFIKDRNGMSILMGTCE